MYFTHGTELSPSGPCAVGIVDLDWLEPAGKALSDAPRQVGIAAHAA